MLDEFRVKLRVVGNLDGTVRRAQIAPRCKRGRLRKFAVAAVTKSIEVDYMHATGRGELDQTQTTEVGIKLGGFSIESDCLVGRQRLDGFAQLFFIFD